MEDIQTKNINIRIKEDVYWSMRKAMAEMGEKGVTLNQQEFIQLAIENFSKNVK